MSYGSVLWFVRKSGRGAILPIALTMAVLFVTAMAFLGLIFTFNEGVNNHTYVALYGNQRHCLQIADGFPVTS